MEKAPFELELRKEERKILKFIPKIRIRRVYDNWEYVFHEETQQMLMERFNEHGITVFIDDGCMGGGGEFLPFHTGYGQSSGIGSEYYKNNFADEALVFIVSQIGKPINEPQLMHFKLKNIRADKEQIEDLAKEKLIGLNKYWKRIINV